MITGRYTTSRGRGGLAIRRKSRNSLPASFYLICFACKLRISESGPAWTRTRDLFLIREARRFAGGFQSLQNTCKYAYSSIDAFLKISGYWPGLLHGCCTQSTLGWARTCNLLYS